MTASRLTRLCPTCSGTGRIEIYRPPFLRPCRNCNGKGRLPEASAIKVVGPSQETASAPSQAVKHG